MTVTEILELVEKHISVSDFAYGKFNTEEGALKPLGEWEEVDRYDSKLYGEDWYSVKYFKDHNVYIKTLGKRPILDTHFYYGFGEEVKPKEKTITIYK